MWIYILLFIILIHIFWNRDIVTMYGEDNRLYYVRKGSDSIVALQTLVLVRKKLMQLVEHIYNKAQQSNHKYKEYIRRIRDKLPHVSLRETSGYSKYTSFSVNKGEELHLCIRSKLHNKFHNINELLYVAIHEIAHIGCPEIGHTDLFFDINKYLLKEAMEMNIYYYNNYDARPIEYCGIRLNHTVLNK